MSETQLLMICIFLLSVIFMMWRPKGINEVVPTSCGAFIVLVFGIVPLKDVVEIFNIISGASITIISTIIMTIVLESIGLFKWLAYNVIKKTNGSGKLLFIYVLLICFLMTIFFNNDGSILITTPIIIHMLNMLKIKPHQKLAYLISGALIATAASAPIAVSNISNLIALKIVGLRLNDYVALMFVPSMIGIVAMALLLYLYFNKDIPQHIQTHHIHPSNYHHFSKYNHPLLKSDNHTPKYDWWAMKVCLAIVILVRMFYFILSPFNIPTEYISIVGALTLIIIRFYRFNKGITDITKKTPWHILLFAFSMYVLVHGLKNIGLNNTLIFFLQDFLTKDLLHASIIMGLLITGLSNIFNNLPAVMLGTLALTEMQLPLETLQVAYLAGVIGSDIGALLTPIGTLATLLWMFILKKNGIRMTWGYYMKVAIMVVPISLLISLLSLYIWVSLIY